MSNLSDPNLVRTEYANEKGLLGRKAAYDHAEGPNAPEIAFEAVAEANPKSVLDVGCGPGELAGRIQQELGANVVGIDLSPRMAELTHQRGVPAAVGDVQKLPVRDRAFDCVLATWMLYHAQDVNRAVGEIARVLIPNGRFVAATNYVDHLAEVRALVGAGDFSGGFSADEGVGILSRFFSSVDLRDTSGTLKFPDRASLASYVEHSMSLSRGTLPEEIQFPFVTRRRSAILVATKA